MANPLAPSLPAHDDPSASRRTAGGIWSLGGDRIVYVGEDALDRALVLVPSEQVLLLAVPLPPMASTVRRRAALPFAIEEYIAQPLDEVHIALGAEIAPGVWLAGVVSHAVMAQWRELLDDAGLDRARLIPDAMALPVPPEGCWSIDLAGPRAVVRTADGSGFAVPVALLDAAWRAAGEPGCIAYGEPLAAQFAAVPGALQAEPLAARLLAPAIDLRQGLYAAPPRLVHPLWQRIAIVAGLGALAHGAIAVADTMALAHLAQQRAAQVRVLGAGLQPPVTIGADLGDALVALTPDPAASASSHFMALLSRSAAALADSPPAGVPAAGVPSTTIWRSVSYDGAAGTLTIELETGDIANLQRMAQALTRAGLSAQPGSATTQGGKAVGSFVVRML